MYSQLAWKTACGKSTRKQANEVVSSQTIHARLGHPSDIKLIKTMQNSEPGQNKVIVNSYSCFCNICAQGKSCKAQVPNSIHEASKKVLERVYSDIAGPIKPLSREGLKYIMTFLDDYSRYTCIILLKSKHQAFEAFIKYCAFAENYTGCKIKYFHTDNGGEYISTEFKKLLDEKGIIHEKTAPYSPHQNGSAERLGVCSKLLPDRDFSV